MMVIGHLFDHHRWTPVKLITLGTVRSINIKAYFILLQNYFILLIALVSQVFAFFINAIFSVR